MKITVDGTMVRQCWRVGDKDDRSIRCCELAACTFHQIHWGLTVFFSFKQCNSMLRLCINERVYKNSWPKYLKRTTILFIRKHVLMMLANWKRHVAKNLSSLAKM